MQKLAPVEDSKRLYFRIPDGLFDCEGIGDFLAERRGGRHLYEGDISEGECRVDVKYQRYITDERGRPYGPIKGYPSWAFPTLDAATQFACEVSSLNGRHGFTDVCVRVVTYEESKRATEEYHASQQAKAS